MSTWSPENSIITNLGNSLLASARVGLGTIKITRVVARETFESDISAARLYTLADITSESIAQTGVIMNMQVTTYPDPEEEVETSLLSVRFANDELESDSTTYDLCQIVIMAKLINPDNTEGAEVPYMVCQCDDSTDCDVMPARSSNPTAFDYDLYVIHSGVDSLTVEVRTGGYVFEQEYVADKAEIWSAIDNLDNEKSSIGQSTEDLTFETWSPVYNSDHSVWNSESTGETEEGTLSAERFNDYEDSENIVIGAYSSAFGEDTEVLGSHSVAFGEKNYVGTNCSHNFVSGKHNTVRSSGNGVSLNNYVSGSLNEIDSSSNSDVSGKSNFIQSSSNSRVSGESNTLNTADDSLCTGSNNSVSAQNTFTAGKGLINSKSYATVIGKYNKEDTSNDYVFIVGNGVSDSERNNAAALDKNGGLHLSSVYLSHIYKEDGTPFDFGGGSEIEGIINGLAPNSLMLCDTENSTVTGSYSVSIGKQNTVSSANAYVIGENNVLTGNCQSSLVTGKNNTVSNSVCRIFGNNNTASNGSGVILDNNNTISNSYGAFITGSNNSVSYARGATILKGLHNAIKGIDADNLVEYSAILNGMDNTIEITDPSEHSKDYSTIINGMDLQVPNSLCVVWGSANSLTTPDMANDALLVIGNGLLSAPSNALVVDVHGNIYCNGDGESLNEKIANLESGSEPTSVELLSAPVVGAVNSIALTDDMNKYDILVFRFGITAEGVSQQFENTLWVRDVYNKPLSEKFFISGYLSHGYGVYYGLSYADSKHFTVADSSQSMWSEDRTIFGITGIKF